MKNALAILAIVAVAAAGQTPAGAPATQTPKTTTPGTTTPGKATSRAPSTPAPRKPSTGPEAPATGRLAGQPRKSPPVPAVESLRFPPLKPIQIPNVTTFTLPDGMKVFLLEDHDLPLVSGVARIRTGNLFDPPDEVGLAEMTGTVMRTGGTKSKTGEQLDQELEDVAASVESNIGESSGSVSFSCLKANAPEVMAIFKDVLTAPEFRQDKIDLERSQLRSGISRRNDNPGGIAQREFRNIVYGKDTPYGWELEYATVDRIKRADIQNFYRRYYFPKNVLLAVWGDFDTAQMRGALEKLFADWNVEQPPAPPFPKVQNKAAPGIYLGVKTQDIAQTFFGIGQLGGELRDKDYPALAIMADILGGGFQSRLVQRVRTRMGAAYDIGADWAADYDHPGIFEISGSTKSLSTVDTIKAVQEEVERIRTTEVSDDELKTAKDTILNSLVFAFDTKTKTLGRMLNYEYYGYPRDFIQQLQKELQGVTRADVLGSAREHLSPAEFTIVAVGNPQDFGTPLESLKLPVHNIDLTIPEPKHETAAASPESIAKAKQLLARAQQAAGGPDKLEAVKDATESADLKLAAPNAGGMVIHETIRWIAPTHYRQATELPSGKIEIYSDGQTGWISTPRGSGALTGPFLKQAQGDLFRQYFRLLLSDRLAGRTVSAIDDNTVEISDEGGEVARVAFDPATGLPHSIRYESTAVQGPPAAVEEILSDFRDTGGVKVPYHVVIMQGGSKFADMSVAKFQVNSGLTVAELEKRP
jgi:zinc protease